jgi:hypothetical protein
MTQPYWSVTVSVNGSEVLTIEPNCLSGHPNIDQWEDTIRAAAKHLIAFIGDEPSQDHFPPDDESAAAGSFPEPASPSQEADRG